MKKLAIVAFVSVVGAAANAQLTGNLYLEQANDAGAGYINQEFADFPTFSTGTGNKVSFGSAVTLSDVQQRYTDFGTFISGGVNSARLTISKFTGSSPSSQHTPGGASSGSDIVFDGIQSATITGVSGTLFTFTVNAAGINVAAGDYLVTATPIAAFGQFGQAFALVANNQTTDSWSRNPGAAFGFGTNWSVMSSAFAVSDRLLGMGINGQPVPEPATLAVLGLGAAAIMRRRNRK